MKKINKIYKLDNSGLSRAFFIRNFEAFNTKLLKVFLHDYSKEKKDIRFCLHQDRKSNLQTMINLIVKKKKYNIHYHKSSDEYYLPLKGSLILCKFEKKEFKLKKKIELDRKKKIMGKVSKREAHIAMPKGKYCIYLEFKSGKFSKIANHMYNKFYYPKV